MRRQLHILIAVLASLLAMNVSMVALADGEEESPPGSDMTQVTTVEADAQEALEVLDGARTSSDEMPVGVATVLDEEAKFGMNPDLSRMAIGNVSGSVYVIPANDHLCVSLAMDEGAGMSCMGTNDVANGEVGPMTQGLDGGGIAIFGIVPDGVASVAVDTGLSGTDAIDVENNAYYVAYGPGTTMNTLTYIGPSGEVEYPLVDPYAAFE